MDVSCKVDVSLLQNGVEKKHKKRTLHSFKLPLDPDGETIGFCQIMFCNVLDIRERWKTSFMKSLVKNSPDLVPTGMAGNQNCQKNQASALWHQVLLFCLTSWAMNKFNFRLEFHPVMFYRFSFLLWD